MGKKPIATRTTQERAFLVGVATGGGDWRQAAEASLDELAQLARAAGAQVVGRMLQRLRTPSKQNYVGEGKLEELVKQKVELDFNVAIFDDALTPLQEHNLEQAIEVKVVDRVTLILDIFAARAQTSEGRLQVELAQHEYLLPRLAGRWTHLERLGAGIGTRGPGESQLETDRRLIRQKINHLKAEIEKIRTHRGLYRHKREKTGIPVVALVGYTNTGKSTLLNALCGSDVIARDEPFSTLDPTTRRLHLPDGSMALLTDTVGFIRKLPPTIVTAFRATLEELAEADLLIHVVDLSSPAAAEQRETVEAILKELRLGEKPTIAALNKADRLAQGDAMGETEVIGSLTERCPIETPNTVIVSARKGWGLNRLVEMIERNLRQTASKAATSHQG